MSAHIVNMLGRRYGNLRAISLVGPNNSRGMIWRFECDCGVRFNADGSEVRRGNKRQCPECAKRSMVKSKTTHGMSGTDEYRIWRAIKSRCLNPNSDAYNYYGGRGIGMFPAWANCFMTFFNDMGSRPTKMHTVERINNGGDYEPSNCVWATRKQQANNKRNNKILTINGRQKTLAQWADLTGINESAIRARIRRGDSGARLIREIQK